MRQLILPLVAATLLAMGSTGCATSYDAATLSGPATPPPPPLGGERGPGIDSDEDFAASPASADEEFEDTDPSAITDFKPSLDPYGTWVDDATYGTVWQPSQDVVGSDFAPYVSNGRWAMDDEDNWIWVSDYDNTFGWATFHYGRWVYTGGGWGWIPGRRYAPAWVTWRVGDAGYGYVGWAPMPPYYYWRGGGVVWLNAYPPAPYVFCGTGDVFRNHVGGYVVGHDRVAGVAGGTHAYGAASAGHSYATPHPGPSRTSGYVPSGSYPASHVAPTPGQRAFQTPSGMGRTPAPRARPNYADGRPTNGNGRSFAETNNTHGLGSPQSHTLSSRATYDGSHASAQYAPAYAHSARTAPSASSSGYRPSYSSGSSYSPSYHSSSSFHSGSSFGGSSFGGGHSSSSSRPSHSSGGHGGHRLRISEPSALISPCYLHGVRSEKAMRKFTFVVACALAAAACDPGPPDNTEGGGVYTQPPTVNPDTGVTPASVTITTGDTIASEPGTGAGVFVEYAGSGEWYVWTTCDTKTSDTSCAYNLFLNADSANGGAINYETQEPADANGDNAVSAYDRLTVEADFTTSDEVDGLHVHVDPPGAPLTVTAWLDAAADARVFYWYGDGVLHEGAPTDPLTLTPNTP